MSTVNYVYAFKAIHSRYVFYTSDSISILKRYFLFLALYIRIAIIWLLSMIVSSIFSPKFDFLIFDNTNDLKYVFGSLQSRKSLLFYSDLNTKDYLAVLFPRTMATILFWISTILRISVIDFFIGLSEAVVVFEGDKPMDMARSFISTIIGRKSIVLQRGSFIHLRPTPVQTLFTCSDFLYYDQTLPQRISKYSANEIFWHKVSDPYISDQYIVRDPQVFFVGQPNLEINLYSDNCMQPFEPHTYISTMLSIFSKLTDLGIVFSYIKHPSEDICFPASENLDIIALKNCKFSRGDIFVGFYSSLLLQMLNNQHSILLIGKNYGGTIFADLTSQFSNVKAVPISHPAFLELFLLHLNNSLLHSEFSNAKNSSLSSARIEDKLIELITP